MVRFHWVREHSRKDAPEVRPYQRGQGSSAVPHQGEFQGSTASRPKKVGIFGGLKAKVNKRIEEAKEAEKQEKAIRAAVRAEEEGKAHEEATQARTKRIEEEERTRAREGSHWKLKRGLKTGARYAIGAVGSTFATPKKRGGRRRKKAAPKSQRRAAKQGHPRTRVTESW
jgi:hypothetical protein